MSLPEPKPIASLTKKSYHGICEYIAGNASPEHTQMILDLMTEAMRATTGFDPQVKADPEFCKKKNEQRRKNAEKEGTTEYEKYIKPRYERLKEQFPGVSTHTLSRMSVSNIQKLVAM